jgi:hypothetical protein
VPENVSIKRVVMTSKQSLIVFGNPYGDYANFFLLTLNAAYKVRRILYELSYPQEDPRVKEIDKMIREGVGFLKSNEKARPWQFQIAQGYSYVDFSHNDWEGRNNYI